MSVQSLHEYFFRELKVEIESRILEQLRHYQNGAIAREMDLKKKGEDDEKEGQAFLISLKAQVKEADKNMTYLAKSIDVIKVKSEQILQTVKQEEVSKDIRSLTEDLFKMTNTIQTDKIKAMNTLVKFFQFIHAGRDEICTKGSLEKCEYLDMMTYLNNDDPDTGDTLIELLQEQNESLQRQLKLSCEQIKIVTDREKLVRGAYNKINGKYKRLLGNKTFCNESYFDSSIEFDEEQTQKTEDNDRQSANAKDLTTTPKPTFETNDQNVSSLQERVNELDNELAATRDILKTAQIGEVLEVRVFTKNPSFKPIVDMTRYLENSLEARGKNCRIISKTKIDDTVNIVCIAASNYNDWVRNINEFESTYDDNKSMAMMLMYAYNTPGSRALEKAQENKADVLSRFRCFYVPYNKQHICEPHKVFEELVDFLLTACVTRKEVVRCQRCLDALSSTQV